MLAAILAELFEDRSVFWLIQNINESSGSIVKYGELMDWADRLFGLNTSAQPKIYA